MGTCTVSPKAQEVTGLLGMFGYECTSQMVVAEMKAQGLTDDMDKEEIAERLLEVWGSRVGSDVVLNRRDLNAPGMAEADRRRMSYCDTYVNVRERAYAAKYAKGKYQEIAESNGLSVGVGGVTKDTVAYVQIDGSTDVDGTLEAISAVLSAGGKVALSEPGSVESAAVAKKWNAVVSKMHSKGVGHTYNASGAFYIFSKGTSLTSQTEAERSANESLESQCDGREMSVNGVFGANYERHEDYAGGETSVFDLIYNGSVKAVAKRIFDKDYSGWPEGTVFKIKRTKNGVDDVIYCRVVRNARISQSDANGRKDEIARATGVKASSLAFDKDIAYTEFEVLGKEKRIGDTTSLRAEVKGKGRRSGRYKAREARRVGNKVIVVNKYYGSKSQADGLNRISDALIAIAKAQGVDIAEVNDEIEALKRERDEKAKTDKKAAEEMAERIARAKDETLFRFDPVDTEINRDKLIDIFGSNHLAKEFIECMAEMILYDLDDRESYEGRLSERIESGELRLEELRGRLSTMNAEIGDDGEVVARDEGVDGTESERMEYVELKREVDSLRRRLSMLREGAGAQDYVRDPDVIKEALERIHDDINQAAWLYEAVSEVLEEHPEIDELNGVSLDGKSLEEKIKLGIKQANNEAFVQEPYKFVLRQYLEDKGSNGDNGFDIRYFNMVLFNVQLHNGMAAIVDDEELWRSCVGRALQSLSKRCGVNLRLSDGGNVESESETVEDEEGNEVEEQEMQENSEREGYSVEVGTVSPMRSMLQKVKQSMFLTPRYVKNDEGEWVEEQDAHFGNTRYMNPTTVCATLLKLLYDCKNGTDMMRRLRAMTPVHPWLKGVTKLLEDDETVLAAYFVSFKKGRLNMRVWRNSRESEENGGGSSMSSWGSNYGEDEAAITDMMRRNIQTGIVLNKEWSLYDSDGLCDVEHSTKLKKMLMKIPEVTKENVSEWLENGTNMEALMNALEACGVECPDSYQLKRMFELTPEVFPDVIKDLRNFAWAVESGGYRQRNLVKYPVPMASTFWEQLVSLGGKLSMLSEDHYDNMGVEAGKSRYGYANPNSIDVMAESIGGDEERFDKFMEERYLPKDENGELKDSFFYDRTTGMAKGWLKDMVESRAYRMLFKLEHQKHVASNGEEYENWSKNTITKMNLGMFLHPMGKRHLNINKPGFDSQVGELKAPMALYSMPIMADSKNFIAVPGRAFWAYTNDEFVNKELLDRYVDVVLQEYRRIRMAKIAKRSGNESSLGVFEKNADRFLFFPSLNEGTFLEDVNNLAKSGDEIGVREYIAKKLYEEVLPGVVAEGLREMKANGFFETDFFEDEGAKERLYNEGFGEKQYWSLFGIFQNAINSEKKDKNENMFSAPTASQKLWGALSEEQREFIRSLDDPLYGIEMHVGTEAERREAKKKTKAMVEGLISTIEKYRSNVTGVDDKNHCDIALDSLRKAGKEFYAPKGSHDKADLWGNYVVTRDGKVEGGAYLQNRSLHVLVQYLLNKTYASTQMIMMTVGDPANIKNVDDFTKRFKQYVSSYERLDLTATWNRVPVLDRSKEDWDCERALYVRDLEAVPDPRDDGKMLSRIKGFYNISQYWNDTVMPMLNSAMMNGELSADEAKMIVDGYSSMNVADGQSLRSPASYRKIMIMGGKWDDAKELAYNKIMSGTATLKDITVMFQSVKPFVNAYEWVTKTGEYLDDDGVRRTYEYSVKVPVQYKNSEFMLFALIKNMSNYCGGENSVLAGIAKMMEEHDIDVVHFSSVVKVGYFNGVDISACRNADDVVNDVRSQLAALRELKDKGMTSHDGIHRAKYYDYGIQMSTPPHIEDTEQGIGTQIRKLLTCDIPLTYRGNDTRIDVRDGEGNIEKSLSPHEYKRMYNAILVEKIRRSFLDAQKEFEDKAELIKIIRHSVLGTDRYSREVVNAISLDENGEFRFPIDHPALASDIQNILTSYLKKHVVKQTTRGGTAYQVSSVGFSETLKPEVEKLPDGTIRVVSIPCLLPIWAKSIYRAYMDKDGNIDINSVPDELREMIGYRVPTEYMYSICPLKVVGFSNQANGSSIILPQEIVSWSGSDFDIDKMFLMIPEFTVPKKPQRRIVDSSRLTQGRDGRIGIKKRFVTEEWEKAWDRHPDLRDKVLELSRQALSEGVSAGKRHLYEYLSEDEAKMMKHEVSEALRAIINDGVEIVFEPEYVKPDLDKDVTDMSDAELNNALMALMRGRLTSNFSYWQNQRVGGFVPQKRQARLMSIIKNVDEKTLLEMFPAAGSIKEAYDYLSKMDLDALTAIEVQTRKKYSYADPMMFEKYHEQNMTGAKMIGIFALANANQALLQDTRVEVSEELNNFFNISINGESRRSLHDIKNADGVSIVTNTAGFLAASVDNAKDPLLEALNMIPMTADIALALLRLGYPMQTVMLIMNSPAVISTVRRAKIEYEKSDGVFSENSTFRQLLPDASPMTLNLTDEMLLNDIINNKVDNNGFCDINEVQSNVLSVVNYALQVASMLSATTDIMKVDSTKSSLQKTKGETYQVAKAIPTYKVKNEVTFKVKGQYLTLNILSNVESMAHSYFFDNLGVVPSTDEYMRRFYDGKKDDGSDVNPGVVQAQAWYDFGVKMGQRLVSKFMYTWGKDVDDVMAMLNGITDDPSRMKLNAICCNEVAEDIVYFRTVLAFKDDSDQRSFKEQREAYLRSFPDYFASVIRKKLEDGVDLRSRYLILSMLQKHEETGEVFFVRSGRIDKNMTDELMASWEQMLTDDDQDVVSLALGMCVYSAFRDGFHFRHLSTVKRRTKFELKPGRLTARFNRKIAGGNFGYLCPVAVLEQFPKYTEALRRLNEPMSYDEKTAFVDQFVRTHELSGQKFVDYGQRTFTSSIEIEDEQIGDDDLGAIFCNRKRTKVKIWKKEYDGYKNESLKDEVVVYANAGTAIKKKFLAETTYNQFREKAIRRYWQYLIVNLNGKHLYRLESQSENGDLHYKKVDFLDELGYDPEAGLEASGVNLKYMTAADELVSATAKDPTPQETTPEVVVASENAVANDAVSVMRANKSKVKNSGTTDSFGVEHNDRETYDIEVSPGNVIHAKRFHSIMGYGSPFDDPTLSDDNKRAIRNAMDVGSAVDTVLRDYFTLKEWRPSPLINTLRAQGYHDPEGLAEGLFDSVIEFAAQYPESAGYQFLADNIVTWRKRSDANGYVAGEVDLLLKKPDGTFALFDFKSSGNPGSVINPEEDSPMETLRNQYAEQLYAYKKMLESQYGINVNETKILFIERTKSSLTMLDPVDFSNIPSAEYDRVDQKLKTWSDDNVSVQRLKKIKELAEQYFSGKELQKVEGDIETILTANPSVKGLRNDVLTGWKLQAQDFNSNTPAFVESITDATKRENAIKEFKAVFDELGDRVC